MKSGAPRDTDGLLKGLHRLYAACCRTPLANTLGSARMPFIGLVCRAIDVDDARLDAPFGPAHGI